MNCIEADNIIYIENLKLRKIKMSEDLMSKVTELQNELKQYKAGVDSLSAQLDAHKQMLNESLNSILQLRTQNIMMQKHSTDVTLKNNQLTQDVARLTQELVDCKAVRCDAASSDT